MKLSNCLLICFAFFTEHTYSQDTFSIVAADSSTREVGSAGASCVDLFSAGIADASFLGDLLSDTGAINTQAYYIVTNQNNARARMRAGDNPAQIITWLTANDAGSNPNIRQYGIVGFTGVNVSAAAHTGVNCMNYKNHKTGSYNGIYYSIQGNILSGQQIIDSMEARFINAQGDLACRLMAALQGAKVVGADTRCAQYGTSSLFSFVKVAQPTDPYGFPSFKISVKTHNTDLIEPIDSLQNIFDIQHNCISTNVMETTINNDMEIFPNPARNKITIKSSTSFKGASYRITDQSGKKIMEGILTNTITSIDIARLPEGIYFVKINDGVEEYVEKIIVQRE